MALNFKNCEVKINNSKIIAGNATLSEENSSSPAYVINYKNPIDKFPHNQLQVILRNEKFELSRILFYDIRDVNYPISILRQNNQHISNCQRDSSNKSLTGSTPLEVRHQRWLPMPRGIGLLTGSTPPLKSSNYFLPVY